MIRKNYDILVIDDEQVVVDAVVKIGEAEGHSVDSARNADAALSRLGSRAYKIVICDVMMPEMDGFEFLQELRRNGIDTPVIMTTGFSTLHNAVKSLLSGAIGFLPKPFTMNELLSRMRRGFKYTELLRRIKAGELEESEVFRRCSDEYFRLGHASWMKIESAGEVNVGVVDLFLKTIDTISRVILLDAGEQIYQGNTCARFETVTDLVHNLLSPVSGRIIARNDTVLTRMGALEEDPYREGWLYKVVPSNLEEERRLLKRGLGI
jgi:CheY-like chemotaxis protein/glycine cleavage system H lipoate-binding protein